MLDKERKGFPEFRSTGIEKDLSPRVFLPIPGTRKMRASADERRQREGG